MTTKKQKILNAILDETKQIAKDHLTVKQLEGLKKYTESRLDTHGRYGYMFSKVVDYKRQLVSINDIESIAIYILDSNFIKISK